MTTIPQRLREIAARLRKPRDGRPWGADDDAADLLDAIAAELEAPAADAAVVSWIAVLDDEQRPHQMNPRLHRVGFQSLRSAEAWIASELDFKGWRYAIEPLVRQRDHLATVAALQARINELESRQEQVRTFLDIAAGEGMELGGVDAGDLYVRLFGHPILDESKEQP